MSKAHRGPGIRAEANHGRGKCPRCGKENIKTLYIFFQKTKNIMTF